MAHCFMCSEEALAMLGEIKDRRIQGKPLARMRKRVEEPER